MKVKLSSKQKTILIFGLGVVLLALGLIMSYFDNYESRVTEVAKSTISSNVKIEETKATETLEKGKVIVKYVDVEGKTIATEEESEDYLGEEYSFPRKEIDGYTAYGNDPINKKGNYMAEPQEVVFVYQNASTIVNVNNESKNVTVQILNEKKSTEYDLKIITKSTDGEVVSGAGYIIKDQNGTELRKGIVHGESLLVGTLTIGEEGKDIYTIEQTHMPTGFKKIINENITINLVKTLNGTTNLYEAKLEYNKVDGLNAYITEDNEIIIEIQNIEIEYGNVILKYVDVNGNKISEDETKQGEIGTQYSFNEIGKTIDGYTFSKVQGKVEGVYTKEDNIITYIYEENKKEEPEKPGKPEEPKTEYGKIIIKYVDESGKEIAKQEVKQGKIGEEYLFDKKGKEIKGYTFNEVKGNIKGVYTKENITIIYTYTKNEEEIFDLELNKSIKSITISDNKKSESKSISDGDKLVKVEIAAKKLKYTSIKILYEIEVKNVGNIPGYAKKITDYIPEDFKYVDMGDFNWKINDDKISTDALQYTLLNPGDTATVTVAFEWRLSENNVGERTNNAQITLYYNDKGLEDVTPDNNDGSSLLVSIKTGALSYTFQILGAILICVGIAILIKNIRDKQEGK